MADGYTGIQVQEKGIAGLASDSSLVGIFVLFPEQAVDLGLLAD